MDTRGEHRAVYVISVAAELAGVHPQTLRIYERKGLVEPARTGGGSRRYSDADIERLQAIQSLTAQGLNLAGVKLVMDLQNQVGELKAQVAGLNAKLQQQQATALVPLRQEIVIYSEST